MDSLRHAWDEDYRRRGRLWGASAGNIPALCPGVRILELGCGDGSMVASLVQAGHEVTAVDFSGAAARLCHNRCAGSGRVGVLVADCRSLPFPDRSFGAVIASHVTGHLAEKERPQLACEIFRLLDRGGLLYFREFSHGDFRYGRGRQTEAATFLRNNGIPTHYFDPGEVRQLFSCLSLRSLDQQHWEMRVRGTTYPRSEIVAEFERRF